MYVRCRKNKSGTTSVFVVVSQREKGKKYSHSVMVKSFGSSGNPKRIAELGQQAMQYKDRTQKLYRKVIPLRISTTEDIQQCQVQSVGITQVYGAIFDRYFGPMSLPKVNLSLLRDLVLMRIACPVSKLKTATLADDYGITSLSVNKIYKGMDRLTGEVIQKIKDYVYQNTLHCLKQERVNVLFYDLTTVYFENNNPSDLKEFGFSKDGKSQHVQISLAFIVTEKGLPIGYEIFKGNVFEGKTLLPVLEELRKRYPIEKVTLVADSAMFSASNLDSLSQNQFDYIVSARIKNVKALLQKTILSPDGYVAMDDDLRYKMISLNGRSLIACFSEKRAAKDRYDRERSLKNLEKLIGTSVKGKLRGALKKPYITLSQQSTIILDSAKLAEQQRYDGYFGFYTNTQLSAPEVVHLYRGLWQIEQSFRITKHNLSIRPVYHYTDRRIKAHFAICFLALALIRTVEYLLTTQNHHVPIETLNQWLRQIKTVQLISHGQQLNIPQTLSPEVSSIYRTLTISVTPSAVLSQ